MCTVRQPTSSPACLPHRTHKQPHHARTTCCKHIPILRTVPTAHALGPPLVGFIQKTFARNHHRRSDPWLWPPLLVPYNHYPWPTPSLMVSSGLLRSLATLHLPVSVVAERVVDLAYARTDDLFFDCQRLICSVLCECGCTCDPTTFVVRIEVSFCVPVSLYMPELECSA